MASRYKVSDEVWSKVEVLLPSAGPQSNQRLFFDAVVYIARTGGSWPSLPAEFGKWNTVFQRFNRYARAGVWARMQTALSPKLVQELQLDGTIVRAHQHSAGAAKKRGRKP